MKIMSGGQTGVDRAALDAAIGLTLDWGGYCPKGRLSEDGTIPAKYTCLVETASAEYPERTRKNVEESDATLILYRRKKGRGTNLTIKIAVQNSKPCMQVDLRNPCSKAEFQRWLSANRIEVLNIAGSRESSDVGIYQTAYDFLMTLLANG